MKDKKPKIKKHGIRYKTAVTVFSLLGLAALTLTSCEPELKPQIEYQPYNLHISNIDYGSDAKGTALFLLDKYKNIDLKQYAGPDQEVLWSLNIDNYDLDDAERIRRCFIRLYYNIEISGGPVPKVSITGLTKKELTNLFNNLSLEYGNVSLSQEYGSEAQGGEVYNLVIDRYKSSNLDTLLEAIDNHKITREDDGPIYFCGTRNDLVSAFNLNNETLTVKYRDNIEPIQKYSDTFGDKLHNSSLTIEQDDILGYLEQNNL